ncbi:MAG: NADAR family protein [Cetobacterium sp.]|uniref:NADAR family protein n=1 Tax=Cetobacterium sp. TaxID=2071632 RepID=UPI003EE4CDB5
MKETSNGFRGEYDFLSNFYPLETPLYDAKADVWYPTVEHFYQAMKFDNVQIRQALAKHPAKGLKRVVVNLKSYISPHWKHRRESAMAIGLNRKYSQENPTILKKLVDTEGVKLVEYNTWGDEYWGVNINTKQGQNRLGEMIENIRNKHLDVLIGLDYILRNNN